MVVIEFFDPDALKNAASALLLDCEKIIFVGDNGRHISRGISRLQAVLAERNISTEIVFKTANKNNLDSVYSLLDTLVQENGEVAFDLTGGVDLILVAVGMLIQKYGSAIKCFRFNFNSNTLKCFNADEPDCKEFLLSVKENITLYGGELITDETRPLYTYDWKYDDEFVADLRFMWELCKNNIRLWNAFTSSLGALTERFGSQYGVSFDPAIARNALERTGIKYTVSDELLQSLHFRGLLTDLFVSENEIALTFKNEQVQKCLTVAGQVLELIVAHTMQSLGIYHDVRVGVVVDWNESADREYIETLNEIDIIAMRNMIPVFISCKNGNLDANELYKLDTVARTFGGTHAKKVIIANALDRLGERGAYIRERAQYMDIRVIDDVDTISDEELARVLKSLWLN